MTAGPPSRRQPGLWRRALPRTFAGRLTLLLIAGFVVILVVGVAAFLDDRRHYARALNVAARADQLAAAAALFGASEPDRRALLARAVASRTLAVRLHPDQPAYDLGARAGPGTAAIAGAVAAATGGPVAVGTLGSWAEDHRGPGPGLLPSFRHLVVLARLADGSWLELRTPLRVGPPWRPLRLVFWVAVIGLMVFVLGRVLARRFARPLERFAEAADRFGLDDTAPPLAEEGPSELRRAAASFNRMQLRVRRLIDDRTLMLAAVAHDLRTALTRLRLRLEMIEDEGERARAAADLDTMRRMLDETLAFARDEAAEETREPVDVAALLQTMADDAADAGQPVAYHGPDRLVFPIRPVAFRRALANLVDNAVRYGERAGLRLGGSAAGLELRIEDAGPGIPKDRREDVFEPFFRLEPSRSRATGGTGLGLAVARSVIHRHGGVIAFDDPPGGGFAVVVSLPAPRPADGVSGAA